MIKSSTQQRTPHVPPQEIIDLQSNQSTKEDEGKSKSPGNHPVPKTPIGFLRAFWEAMIHQKVELETFERMTGHFNRQEERVFLLSKSCPLEGTGHAKPLHMMVQQKNYYRLPLELNNGLRLNISRLRMAIELRIRLHVQ